MGKITQICSIPAYAELIIFHAGGPYLQCLPITIVGKQVLAGYLPGVFLLNGDYSRGRAVFYSQYSCQLCLPDPAIERQIG